MNLRFSKRGHLVMTILIMALIFIHSALPADLSAKESNIIALALADLLKADPERVSLIVRKTAHFLEYFLLGISLYLTAGDYIRSNSLFVPWGIGAFYALTDEFHQAFVPGRSCELTDVLIDCCGLAVGVGAAKLGAKLGACHCELGIKLRLGGFKIWILWIS